MPFLSGSLTNPITLRTSRNRTISVQAGSFIVALAQDEYDKIGDQIGEQLINGNLTSYAVMDDSTAALVRTKYTQTLQVPNVHSLIFKQNLDFLAALSGGTLQGPTNNRVNALKAAWNAHLINVASFSADGQHKATDLAHVIATADASDLTTCIALINAIKSAIIAHGNRAGIHFSNDTGAGGTGFTITVDPPVTLPDCVTDANDILTGMTTHMGLGTV